MTGFVYILTNQSRSVLYTGVTNNIRLRLQQHRDGTGSAFVKRYNAYYLIYMASCSTMPEAIHHEKIIKGMSRKKKVQLITAQNPNWDDMAPNLADIY